MLKAVLLSLTALAFLTNCSPGLSSKTLFGDDASPVQNTTSELPAQKDSLEVVVYQYDYSSKSLRYGMDEFLNLRFHQKSFITLKVQLKKSSARSSTGYELEDLSPGRYRVRWALLSLEAEDFSRLKDNVISVGEHTVALHASASSLQFPVEWIIENAKGMSNTNVLTVQVSPEKISDKAELSPTLFKSRLLISSSSGSSQFEAVYMEKSTNFFDMANTQLLNDKHKRYSDFVRRSDKKFVAQEELLRTINLNSEDDVASLEAELIRPRLKFSQFKNDPPRDLGMNRAELRLGLRQAQLSDKLADRLCMLWFHSLMPIKEAFTNQDIFKMSGSSQYNLARNCSWRASRKNADYFNIQTVYFVKNPNLQNVTRSAIQNFSISSKLSSSNGRGSEKAWNWSTSIGLEIPFKFGSASASTGISGKESISRNSDFSSGFSTDTSMTMESLKMNLTVQSAERCTVIRLNPKNYSGKGDFMTGFLNPKLQPQTRYDLFRQGLLICDGLQKPYANVMEEDYYILNQQSSEQIVDSNSSLGHPFFAVIRGKTELNRFLSSLHTKVTLHDEREAESLSSALESLFMVKLPSYPSQLQPR
jgi:hypothetical protein